MVFPPSLCGIFDVDMCYNQLLIEEYHTTMTYNVILNISLTLFVF